MHYKQLHFVTYSHEKSLVFESGDGRYMPYAAANRIPKEGGRGILEFPPTRNCSRVSNSPPRLIMQISESVSFKGAESSIKPTYRAGATTGNSNKTK
jgi:hypothetical protein